MRVDAHRAGGLCVRQGAAAHIGRQVGRGRSVGEQGTGVGVHAQNPQQGAGCRLRRPGQGTHVLRTQDHYTAFAVHAQYLTVCRGQLFGAGGSSLGPGCTPGRRGAAGAGLPGSSLCLCGTGSAAFGAGRGALGRRGGCAGTFQHAGHELLVQGGRQVLGAAVGGQGGIGVVPAGAGVGGVAGAAHGGQHPLPTGAAGEAAVHRHAGIAVQRHRGQLGAVAAAQVQGNGAVGPAFGQLELQPVHAFRVLCAQVQAAGLRQEFGAAAGSMNDLDLHGFDLPFRFFLFDCTPGRAAAEVCSFSPQISGIRHFAGGVFLGVIRGQFRVRKMPGGGPGFVQKTAVFGRLFPCGRAGNGSFRGVRDGCKC